MLLLSSAYLAPVHYYARLLAADCVVEERCDHYVKQTYRNRCLIAAPQGVQALSLPVEGRSKAEGGDSKTPTGEMRLSEHGRWREMHWNALVAAYERTPYFDYYADDFLAVYRDEIAHLADFNERMLQLVLSLLDLDIQRSLNTQHYRTVEEYQQGYAGEILDFRETIRPKLSSSFDPQFQPQAYYQVFAARHGFLPNLSIVDLLFNMGPESRIVLRRSLQK